MDPRAGQSFLHYVFDMWMQRNYPHISFERYADDTICHCSKAQARMLSGRLKGGSTGLTLQPAKTKIV